MDFSTGTCNSWRSSSPCSPRLPCPAFPAAAVRVSWCICSIFFPDQLAVAFPIALALGNLVDPPATMVNSAGDYVVSFIVARFVDGKDWLQKRLSAKAARK